MKTGNKIIIQLCIELEIRSIRDNNNNNKKISYEKKMNKMRRFGIGIKIYERKHKDRTEEKVRLKEKCH